MIVGRQATCQSGIARLYYNVRMVAANQNKFENGTVTFDCIPQPLVWILETSMGIAQPSVATPYLGWSSIVGTRTLLAPAIGSTVGDCTKQCFGILVRTMCKQWGSDKGHGKFASDIHFTRSQG